MPAVPVRDGVEIAYDEAGTGPPLVFLHGVGSTRAAWDGELRALSDRWRCVAIDLRGSGASRAPATSISLVVFAADVAQVVDHLGDIPAHVCGLSLGAIVALHLWAQRPDLVRSLILADAWAVHGEAAAALPQRLAAIDATPMEQLARERMPRVLGPSAPAELVERAIAEMAGKDRASYRRSNEVLWGADVSDIARTVRAPTLVLVGELDTVTPPALNRRLAELIPGGRFAVIPGAGHLSNQENPAEFHRLVREFLCEVGESSR